MNPDNGQRTRLRPLDSCRDRKWNRENKCDRVFSSFLKGFFNCVVLDSQPTKSVPRATERNIDEMCPKRNPQPRLQHENLDVRSVGTTRPFRGVALFDETCDFTDEDAQEATVQVCRSVNPGIIILGISRTVSRSHLEFCMTLCAWQHERGALYIMILTDSEDSFSEEQFSALKTLHRSEGSAWLGRDLRQVGFGARLDSQPSCRSRVDQFIHGGRTHSTRKRLPKEGPPQSEELFHLLKNCNTRWIPQPRHEVCTKIARHS